MYCTKCGKRVDREDALFCPFCGNALDRDIYTQNMSSDYSTHTQQNYSYNQYQRRHDPYDAPSFGWSLLSFLVPVIGLVLYLVWHDESPLKAKSCLKGFIASIVLDVIIFCCFCGALSSSDYYYMIIKSIL